jgi:hypothetical protein
LATNYEVQATGADALKIAAELYPRRPVVKERILLRCMTRSWCRLPASPKVVKIVCETMRAAFLELLEDFPVLSTTKSLRGGDRGNRNSRHERYENKDEHRSREHEQALTPRRARCSQCLVNMNTANKSANENGRTYGHSHRGWTFDFA